MIYVLEGELQIAFAANIKSLSSGDFIIFSSAQSYSYLNESNKLVKFTRNVVS